MLQQLSAEELPKVEKEIIDFINTYTTHEELKESMLYSINAGEKDSPVNSIGDSKSFSKRVVFARLPDCGSIRNDSHLFINP